MKAARIHASAPVVLAAGCAALAAGAVWSTSGTGDYVIAGPVAGDNPAPSIDAVAHGHVGAFASHQPLMGLVSLLLRAPVVAGSNLFHGGELLSYRVGALACLLCVPLLMAWIARRRLSLTGRVGRDEVAALVLAGVIMLVAPPVRQALSAGHPEDLLAGVLAAAAVVAAIDDKPVAAGVAFGLAVGTKQWAVVAVVPVMAALPGRRMRALGCALVAAAAATLPMVIADPAAFARASREVGATHLVNSLSAWWPTAGVVHGPAATVRVLPWGLTRTEASTLVATLLVVCATGMAASGRRLARREDALALLAVVMLLRFVGDPLPIVYYATPAIVALALWEAMARSRVPVVTVLVGVALALEAAPRVGLQPGAMNAFVLATTFATAAYLLQSIGIVGWRLPSAIRQGTRRQPAAKAVAPAADR
jgi:hypothetical protein